MRFAYSLNAVTRLYEAALSRQGAEAIAADAIRDLGVLARAEAVGRERAKTEMSGLIADRHGILGALAGGAFVDSYDAAEALFSMLGMEAPSAQAFSAAGVDWELLAAAYERLDLRAAEPALLVAPVLPFMGHSANTVGRSWQDLYAQLTEHPGPEQGPLRARPDGLGLQLGTALHTTDAARALFEQEQASARAAESHSVEDSAGATWTVSVVALSDAAAQGNHPYSAFEGGHLRPSEYLALQALRIRAGETPIDEFGWTWLEGVLDLESGWHALAGVWVPGYGQIRIYSNPVAYAQERLHVRTPIRG